MKKLMHIGANVLLVLFHIIGIFWLELNCAMKVIFAYEWEMYFDYIPLISAAIILGVHYGLLCLLRKRGLVAKAAETVLIASDLFLPAFIIVFVLVPNRCFINLSMSQICFFIVAIQLIIMIPRIVYAHSRKHLRNKK